MGGSILLKHEALSLETSDQGVVSVKCESGARVTCRYAITCAGAYSDRIAKVSGGASSPIIVPFR